MRKISNQNILVTVLFVALVAFSAPAYANEAVDETDESTTTNVAEQVTAESARQVSPSAVARARAGGLGQRVQNGAQSYEQIKDKYVTLKSAYVQTRDQIRSGAAVEDLDAAKEYAQSFLELTLSRVDRVKDSVSESSLSEERQAEFLEKLAGVEDDLEAFDARAQDAASVAELRLVTAEVRTYYSDLGKKIREAGVHVALVKLGKILNSFERASNAIIKKMDEAAVLDDYQSDIDAVTADIVAAKDLHKQGLADIEVGQLEDGHEKLKEAYSLSKDIHTELRILMNEFRQEI